MRRSWASLRAKARAARSQELTRARQVRRPSHRPGGRSLSVDPRPTGARPLVGNASLLRIRISEYGVVYTVKDGELVVLALGGTHRRDVYRNL
jgi:mRNA-degrading endonuclease RelE of RelBE toxin-antitoxin system